VVRVLALTPTPIGVGARYHPPPAIHGACTPGSLRGTTRAHVELFANKRVVIVPAAVGLRGATFRLGRVTTARCRARVWTRDPTGVVEVTGSRTLGDVFAVWGRRLGRARLLSFAGAVTLYRNGVPVRGDPATQPLRNGDEIVLEVGGYVPPHSMYRFPR
jgi:hypothetical protein